jgi:hypothetical protein
MEFKVAESSRKQDILQEQIYDLNYERGKAEGLVEAR